MEIEQWQQTAAREAYNKYSESVGGKAFNGDELPTFDHLPVKIYNAWINAATAAVNSRYQ